MDKYKISIIIPIYNQEKNIENCIHVLKHQTVAFQRLEIILVNDGSIDNSDKICENLKQQYSNIVYLKQQNKGVSSARNAGICAATGKYIFFLDADDGLSFDTIEKVSKFFDSVYEITDLVTYQIETIYEGKKLPMHFRYQYLVENEVYDLCKYPYIGQTTMNIAVKNKFDQNILFDELQSFSEDQKYCCDVLQEKLKMGFCKDGKYIYYRSVSSSSGQLSGACYIFEQCMKMFEEIFDRYEEVPLAFQGLYVNDIYWKMLNNILFPYHYKGIAFSKAVERIKNLLNRCCDSVILEHPAMDFFEKFYIVKLKNNHKIESRITEQAFSLYDEGKLLVQEISMEAVITKMNFSTDTVQIEGFIKSVFLQFYKEEPIVCAIENNGEIVRKLELVDSTHNYYLSHEKTQHFKAFQYECKISETQQVSFEVELGGRWFPIHYYFMPLVPLSHRKTSDVCRINGIECRWDGKNTLTFSGQKKRNNKEIWLYYDCSGVSCDNGFLQFEHDMKTRDNIERYYIVTDKRQAQDKQYKQSYVSFGSRKHRQLLRKCTKILTAYIEESNILPYKREEYKKVASTFNPEIVYLQHGVLHIIMPWKYSREKLLADRIIVSTKEEAALYIKNGYKEKDLIKTGMPRFECMEMTKKKRKILFAPSWRAYLVGKYINHTWQKLPEKFVESKFYKEIQKFLCSYELNDFLDKYDYELEVKLHPIFKMYEKSFSWSSNRIFFTNDSVKESEYALFITDFSSYAFNFSYLSIPVLHFIPDRAEFECGMNGYRELNYSEKFWEEAVFNSYDLVIRIKEILLMHKIIDVEASFYKCKDIREAIYLEIIKEAEGVTENGKVPV